MKNMIFRVNGQWEKLKEILFDPLIIVVSEFWKVDILNYAEVLSRCRDIELKKSATKLINNDSLSEITTMLTMLIDYIYTYKDNSCYQRECTFKKKIYIDVYKKHIYKEIL